MALGCSILRERSIQDAELFSFELRSGS